MEIRIALTAGHRNSQGGNQLEMQQMAKLTPAIAKSCRDLGMKVRVYTPNDGAGMSSEGYVEVAAKVVKDAQNGWIPLIYMETHSDAGPPGVFCVYPDWGNDVDVDVKNGFGLDISKKIEAATGLRVRGGGIMSEKSTYVGSQGYRLGIFAVTAPIKTTTTRLILECGSHTHPGDIAIMAKSGFYLKAGKAVANTFLAFAQSLPEVRLNPSPEKIIPDEPPIDPETYRPME